MSLVLPAFNRSVIVRAADAEIVGAPNAKVTLLADSSATGGEEPPESLRDVQDLYDTYFLNSPEWEAARR